MNFLKYYFKKFKKSKNSKVSGLLGGIPAWGVRERGRGPAAWAPGPPPGLHSGREAWRPGGRAWRPSRARGARLGPSIAPSPHAGSPRGAPRLLNFLNFLNFCFFVFFEIFQKNQKKTKKTKNSKVSGLLLAGAAPGGQGPARGSAGAVVQEAGAAPGVGCSGFPRHGLLHGIPSAPPRGALSTWGERNVKKTHKLQKNQNFKISELLTPRSRHCDRPLLLAFPPLCLFLKGEQQDKLVGLEQGRAKATQAGG